jgi:hypothetical protein
MVGARGTHQHASDLQRRNAQARRPNARGGTKRSNGQGKVAVADVAPAPVAGDAFSITRAQAVQCIQGVKYAAGLSEKTYFVGLLGSICDKLTSAGVVHPVLAPLQQSMQLDADLCTNEATVTEVEYGQLKLVTNPQNIDPPELGPPESEDVTAFTDCVDNTDLTKPVHMVKSPVDQRFYEVQSTRNWPWSMCITYQFKVDSPIDTREDETKGWYTLKVQMGKRSREMCWLPEHKERQSVLKAEIGEYSSRAPFPIKGTQNSIETKALYSGDNDLIGRLFYQQRQKGSTWLSRLEAEPEEPAFVIPEFRAPAVRQRWHMEPVGGRMCLITTDSKTGERDIVSQCNFILHSLDAHYQFGDGSSGSWSKITCKKVYKESGSTHLLRIEDQHRCPDLTGVAELRVEVLIDTGKLRTPADLCGLFKNHYPDLGVSSMSIEMLTCWLAEQPDPPIMKCIARFGRQSDGSFVSGNVHFGSTGVISRLENRGWIVVPKYFADSLQPLARSQFPMNLIIPYPHVRYKVFCDFWNHKLPAFFVNNSEAAMAVIALTVMGFYSSRIWGGEAKGCGCGMPLGWIYSKEQATGKSQAMIAAAAIQGFSASGMLAGSSTINVSILERCFMQADLTVLIDDYVPTDVKNPASRQMAQLDRAIFDRTMRSVCNKNRTPNSSIVISVCGIWDPNT